MAHIMKAKVSDAGKLDTEALDEKYRAKQDRVDASRTAENRWYHYSEEDGKMYSGRPKKGTLSEAVKGATEQHKETAGRKARSDAVGSVNIVITLPPELRDKVGEKAEKDFWWGVSWFLQKRYGENFVGGALHYDESTPHMHAFVTPMLDGKLNAKKMFDRVEFQSFHGDLQSYMDGCFGPGVVSVLTSTEEERAERRQARPGSEGKKTLAELKADTVRAEREYDDVSVQLTAKKKELETCSAEVIAVQTQKEELTSSVQAKKKELEECTAEVDAQKQELSDTKKELVSAKYAAFSAREEQEEEEKKLDLIREETAKAREEYHKANEAYRNLVKLVNSLGAYCQRIKNWLAGPADKQINDQARGLQKSTLQQATSAEAELFAMVDAMEERAARQNTQSNTGYTL